MSGMRFELTTENPGPLSVHELLERYANELWIPEHLADDQAAGFVLDHFRRQVESELAMVTIERKAHCLWPPGEETS
jgi:hypothetical protein